MAIPLNSLARSIVIVLAPPRPVKSGREVKIVWEPINKAQAGFVATDAGSALFSGAFGAGKTIALCAKALKLSLDYPGNFGYICRKTRASITFSTLETFFKWVCPREVIAEYNKSELLVTLTN